MNDAIAQKGFSDAIAEAKMQDIGQGVVPYDAVLLLVKELMAKGATFGVIHNEVEAFVARVKGSAVMAGERNWQPR